MRQRYENLQVLRGVACLAVLALHVAACERGYGPALARLGWVHWIGFAGVDLFFVLSGFIIAATCRDHLGQPRELPRYLARRCWRVYPIYWAALGLGVAVFAALAPEPITHPNWFQEWVETLLLLPQANLPRFLPVSWTLSYELHFYTMFALLFLVPKRFAGVAVVGWAVVVATLTALSIRPENRHLAFATNPLVLEFAAGCLIAWRPVRLSARAALGLTLAAAGWCGGGSILAFDPDPAKLPVNYAVRALVFGVPMALIVLAATGWERDGGRLRSRALARIGDASYSIYLVHVPLLMVTNHLTHLARMSHSRTAHLGWIALMFAVPLALGLLLHRFVEAPLMRLGRRPAPRPAEATQTNDAPAPRRAA